MRSRGTRAGPKPMTGVFTKRGKFGHQHTQGKTPPDNRGRDCGAVSTGWNAKHCWHLAGKRCGMSPRASRRNRGPALGNNAPGQSWHSFPVTRTCASEAPELFWCAGEAIRGSQAWGLHGPTKLPPNFEDSHRAANFIWHLK